nr:E3 ubiquitin-protein ligase BRE1-like 2 isoform X2 [Physcomitrium patens]|eukprot:XP_024387250.1 E3 ubiquitin-protein ligase BRE1-like 2 isoform X2 [Physcomitrella patens]
MGSTEEPERKRRHNNLHHPLSASPPLKKPAITSASDDKKVEPVTPQYQNQKLAQLLDHQRSEISTLESRCAEFKSKQASYDNTLIAVNRKWNLLVDDLEFLAVRANTPTSGLEVLEPLSVANERKISAAPPEETFLQRLLETGATESSNNEESSNGSVVEAGLVSRKAKTMKTMKYLLQAIDLQRAKNDKLETSLRDIVHPHDAGQLLEEKNEDLRTEITTIRGVLEALHLKHNEMLAEIGTARDLKTKDQSKIKCLSGELEETASELELCRRKLATLKSQKEAAAVGMPTIASVQLSAKIEGGDRVSGAEKLSREARELEAALEEMKTLASKRLTELQETLQTQLNLSQRMQQMQDALLDEQRILSSRPYLVLDDQAQFLKNEVERYRGLVDKLQTECDSMSRRDKEILLKAEAGEAAHRTGAISDDRAAELETKLQECMADRDALQLRLEDALQSAGRKDSVPELQVMKYTLEKEMSMTKAQLRKPKDAACEVELLEAKMPSLREILERKALECKNLSNRCVAQAAELTSLKAKLEGLRQSDQGLQLMLEMYEKESKDPRTILKLQQDHSKTLAQIERLKRALDEHSLELRVKAANEAETLYQQRLAAAEAEIAEYHLRLDDSERVVMELKETLKSKDEEGDAYVIVIETFGQAYDEMLTQNSRLLHQITERDDYNTQLVAESQKAKQLQSFLEAEKKVLASRVQHAIASADPLKQHVNRLEDQILLGANRQGNG